MREVVGGGVPATSRDRCKACKLQLNERRVLLTHFAFGIRTPVYFLLIDVIF